MRLTEISLLLALNSLALGQTTAVLKVQPVESHGTCAAAVVAPFGEALVHYRSVGEEPGHRGVVAEMLLLTKVNGLPYFRRTTVEWDGSKFDGWIEGQVRDKRAIDSEYSGACRLFMNHTGYDGKLVPRSVPYTIEESLRLDEIGKRKMAATTTDDLADVAYSYALLLTDIDTRLEGEKAVIAAPYSHARWAKGEKGWTVEPNPKCKADASTR